MLNRLLREEGADQPLFFVFIRGRTVGKTAIRDVDRTDMFALDAHSAEVAGVPLGYLRPPDSS
ncbi:MAG: hypothetical protein U1D96_00205 [Eubacteriales bacterium]|nr:hypothetical protein [Bacillota bacterium]MBV1727186.1 hypothetical protein [Desulforudis sp.]MDP3049933.1 hypothetical protein [Eubacteriales bacterium]MDQ7789245.1 hypothetical protein [Clostridia bacterium]MBU4533774.1 hypothetical protein [Bacillota bacterium]